MPVYVKVLVAAAVGAGALAAGAFVMGPQDTGPVAFRETVEDPIPGDVRIADEEFGALIDRLSEPEGYFDTDNFISNETSYLHVVGRLHERVSEGGAYLGVGPDQNFTYIVHSLPSVAIVADIRRQNMLEHLLLKILIQDASDRGDFLCALFARDCSGGDGDAGLEVILDRVSHAASDPERLEATLPDIIATLETRYRVNLSVEDVERIGYVYASFARSGPDLRFSSFGGNNVAYPTFAELMLETDGSGVRASYLASEGLFQRLKEYERSNRLIPIVADFAGNRALPAAADYLAEIGVGVSVVYTSNVEYYLFGTRGWDEWIRNIGRFRFRPDAVFIRAYFPTYGRVHPENVRGYRPTTLIQAVDGFLDDAASGEQATYWDVVFNHRF